MKRRNVHGGSLQAVHLSALCGLGQVADENQASFVCASCGATIADVSENEFVIRHLAKEESARIAEEALAHRRRIEHENCLHEKFKRLTLLWAAVCALIFVAAFLLLAAGVDKTGAAFKAMLGVCWVVAIGGGLALLVAARLERQKE